MLLLMRWVWWSELTPPSLGLTPRRWGAGERDQVGVPDDLAARAPGAVGLLMDQHPHAHGLIGAEPGGRQHGVGGVGCQPGLAAVRQRTGRYGDVDPEPRLAVVAGRGLRPLRQFVEVRPGLGPEELIIRSALPLEQDPREIGLDRGAALVSERALGAVSGSAA